MRLSRRCPCLRRANRPRAMDTSNTLPQVPSVDGRTPLRRVLVYGVTGSGKSTAAGQIAARTGLPVTLVDDQMWQPGWLSVPEHVQRTQIHAVVTQDRWVLDTAYASWLDVVLPRVDLVVGLDYPRWFSFQRLLRRTASRVVHHEVVCNGNTETLGRMLGPDSILLWHFRSFARKRRRLRQWAASPDGPPTVLFSRPGQLQAWLDGLDRGSPRVQFSPD